MIARYRLIATRIRNELRNIEVVVGRAENARQEGQRHPDLRSFFISSAALDLHGFYAGLERLFEHIARELDGSVPSGSTWHRDLLSQMTLEVSGLRLAVIQQATQKALTEYLEFRHVVRSVYTYDLEAESIEGLVGDLRSTFKLVQRDLLAFADFLDQLSTADEG